MRPTVDLSPTPAAPTVEPASSEPSGSAPRTVAGPGTLLRWWVLALALLGLALGAYQQRLGAPLTSDARFLTYRNADVVEAEGIGRFWTADYFQGAMTPTPYLSGYYRPVTNTLFWLEYRWAGTRDGLYNVSQVVLHALNALLLALLVAGLSGDRRVGALAGLLFVVHPVHAFAATEPAARADVLFATFYLLALLAFDASLRREGLRRAGLLALVVVLYLLSTLSKEMGITLPATLVLLALFRHRTDGLPLRALATTLPVWAAGLAYGLWRFVLLDLDPSSMGYVEVHSRWALLVAALKTIPVHLSRILFPLQPTYPELNPHLLTFVSGWTTDPLTWAALAVTASLVVGALLWRRAPVQAFWCGFFLVAFSPLLKVDNIGGTLDTDVILAQERWIYLPATAILALLAHGAVRLLDSARTRGRALGLLAAGAVVVAVLGWEASLHAGRHADPFALLRSLYLIPEARLDRMQEANRLMLYANLVALPMGDAEEAEARVRRALELVPDSPLVGLNVARVLAERGKWEEVRAVLGPWLAPSQERLRSLHATNFRVYDDMTRVGPDVALLLGRAEARLGRPGAALSLVCESALRGGVDVGTTAAWAEIWALEGRSPAPALPPGPATEDDCGRWADRLSS